MMSLSEIFTQPLVANIYHDIESCIRIADAILKKRKFPSITIIGKQFNIFTEK